MDQKELAGLRVAFEPVANATGKVVAWRTVKIIAVHGDVAEGAIYPHTMDMHGPKRWSTWVAQVSGGVPVYGAPKSSLKVTKKASGKRRTNKKKAKTSGEQVRDLFA